MQHSKACYWLCPIKSREDDVLCDTRRADTARYLKILALSVARSMVSRDAALLFFNAGVEIVWLFKVFVALSEKNVK